MRVKRWAIVLLLSGAACGGGGAIGPRDPGGQGDPGSGDADGFAPDPGEDTAPDGDQGAEGRDAVSTEGADDAGPDPMMDLVGEATDAADASDGEVPPECPGNPGCPCMDSSDCFSEQCMETPDGWRCSSLCATGEKCPDGWACVAVSGSGSDVVSACVNPFARSCRPCRLDADCIPAIQVPGRTYACVDHGPNGSFCGVSCGSDDDCQGSEECVETAGGKKYCRPAGGAECPCTDFFIENGFVTTCFVENADGRCKAERTCDVACPAPTPAAESCNATDDDCDGKTDEEVPVADCPLVNAYGTCTGKTLCGPGGQVQCQGTYASPEFCNGFDDDCDGTPDPPDTPGCEDFLKDGDQDGWGVDGDVLCLCKASAPYTADEGGDCDDEDPLSHPGLPEVCDGRDNDCDGTGDAEGTPGCTTHWRDADGDGAGDPTVTACMCGPDGRFVANANDCDDADEARHPGAEERCNGLDDDCDGDLPDVEADADKDGVSACDGDCDDMAATRFPGADEACNGVDDDCDGLVPLDEGDEDHDLFMPCAGDCDDQDPTRRPGAEERCDLVDQDCDEVIDEGCAVARVFEEFTAATLDATVGDLRYLGAIGVPGPAGVVFSAEGSSCCGVLCGVQ